MCYWSPLSWHCPTNNLKLPSSHSWHVVVSSESIIPHVCRTVLSPRAWLYICPSSWSSVVFLPGTEVSVQLPTGRCPVLFQMTQRVWVRPLKRLGVPAESCAGANLSPYSGSSVGVWALNRGRSFCNSQPHLFSPAILVLSLLILLRLFMNECRDVKVHWWLLSLWKWTIYLAF